MKKVSVIIPVYNLEDYLERSLSAITSQTLKDIEIIIINDGSTDNSQEIIEKYKSLYPNLIKIIKTENHGLATARNIAFEEVTGEYTGFFDGDDYISKDMYEKLYLKAKEEDSDIVCCNFYRNSVSKRFYARNYGWVDSPSDIFGKSIYESEGLFDEVPYVWNKIYKTEMLRKNHIKFKDGVKFYEDVLYTFSSFAHANKISQLDEKLYVYNISRPTSLTNTLIERRLALFEVAEDLINYYKSIGKYEEAKEGLIFLILKHCYILLEKENAEKDIKKIKLKFINMMFDFLKTIPGWKDNNYFKVKKKSKFLYTSKLYWKLCTIFGFNIRKRFKMATEDFKTNIKRVFIKTPGEVYINNINKPIDEKSIMLFPEYGKDFNGNLFYILKELINDDRYKDFKIYVGYARKAKTGFVRHINEYNLNKKNVVFIKKRSRQMGKILATTKYIFSDANLPIYFIKRSDQIYINMWHGTPLKTLGRSEKQDFYNISNTQKCFIAANYLIYQNRYMMEHIISDYMLNGFAQNKIILSGSPRNEAFFKGNSKIDIIKKKENILGKEIIAYMPTWRGTERSFDEELQLKTIKENLKKISKRLNHNQILYVNVHSRIKKKLNLLNLKNVKSFPNNYETYDFLSVCDILITDYSSIIFDFVLTRKKIIIYDYDREEYEEERGLYIPLEDLPFPKAKNVTELLEKINYKKDYDEKEFIENYCKYDRKDISKLICERVILNKENSVSILDMEKSEKENVLIYSDSFNPSSNMQDFIEILDNTKNSKYNYYVGFLTSTAKKNRETFGRIKDKIKYFGQVQKYVNLNQSELKLIKDLGEDTDLYFKNKEKIDTLNSFEIKRTLCDIKNRAIIIFGSVEYRKIYQLHTLCAKKIMYLSDSSLLNLRINRQIYNEFDYILVTSKQIYEYVKEYCQNDKNIKLIDKIKDLNDFNEYIDE